MFPQSAAETLRTKANKNTILGPTPWTEQTLFIVQSYLQCIQAVLAQVGLA